MRLRTVTVALVAACLAAGLAAPSTAADSVRIVKVTPASGAFPMMPATADIELEYEITSSPWARLAVEPVPKAQVGLGQTAPGGAFMPCWVPKGKGTKTMKSALHCDSNTVPAGLVTGLRAQIHATAASGAPPEQLLVEQLLPVQYTYTCAGGTALRPDITVLPNSGIMIGAKKVPWGGAVTLAARDARAVAGGRCSFEGSYVMANGGEAPTNPAFSNRMIIDSPRIVAAADSNLTLNAHEKKTVPTKLSLVPGTHTLVLRLDADNQVAESKERNNEARITYTLTGGCGLISH